PGRVVKPVLYPHIPEITITFPPVIYFYTGYALPEHRKIEVFIGQVYRKSIFKFWSVSITDPHTVIIVINLSVGFPIRPGNILIPYPADAFAGLISCIIHFFLVLEKTICDKTV